MAKAAEYVLLGGGNTVVQPDALIGFGGSAEAGVRMVIRSKRYAPIGPAADAVGKRLFVQGRHAEGVAFKLTPTADGRSQRSLSTFFSRAPTASAGDDNRFSFMVPLSRSRKDGLYTTGIRATTFGFEIEAEMPVSEFHIESVNFELEPLMVSRGRRNDD